MSLVVAYATEDGPRVVADTRVTFLDGTRSSYRRGTLKAVTLSRDVAVCFAGKVGEGLPAIREASKTLALHSSVAAIREHLAAVSRTKDVEFLIATSEATNQLTRIREGVVEESLSVAWVGDKEAFERFQLERNRPLHASQEHMRASLPFSSQAMIQLQDGMRAVIDDEAITSVDDFCVSLAHKAGAGFRYLEYAFALVGADFEVRNGEDLVPKMIQGVDVGAFQVCVCGPEATGVAAVGLHFANARLGMVYLPLVFDEAQVVADVSADDFSRVGFERFGVRLTTPLIRNR
jgi:hypothetical protein